MGFGTNGFGAGGIGDGVVTTNKVDDDSQTQLGSLSLQPTSKSKVNVWNFEESTIDTTKFTSTVVSGTNTVNTTNQFGGIATTTTATANRSAKMVSNVANTLGADLTGALFEFVINPWTLNATTGKIQFVMSPVIDGTKTANSMGLGYNITGGAVGWEFYTTDAANTAQTDTGLTVSLQTTHTLSFVVGDGGLSISCYIDGVQVGTTHSTNIPAGGTAMYIG